MRLVAVVLGARDAEKRRMESEKLLAWGFRTFATVRFGGHKDVPDSLPVYGGKVDQVPIAPVAAPLVTILKGQEKRLEVAAAFPSRVLVAPVAKDATVGELRVSIDGNGLAAIPIRTQAAVDPGSFFKRMIDHLSLTGGELLKRVTDRLNLAWDELVAVF